MSRNCARVYLISWPADARATNYSLHRKTRDATALATNATNYGDSAVAIGGAYEYRVIKLAPTGSTNYAAKD